MSKNFHNSNYDISGTRFQGIGHLCEPKLSNVKEVLADLLILHVELRDLLMTLPRPVRKLVSVRAVSLGDEIPGLGFRV